jgi:hypothetical protein
MGVLIKVILFGIVFYYLLKTVGGFVLRVLGVQNQTQAHRQPTHQARKEGQVNIDYVPEKGKKRNKKGPGAGEYIDYEEVK